MTTQAPQLTWRAVGTGMVLGGALSLCNVYGSLKIGLSFNMSIVAALLGYAFWRGLAAAGARPFGLLENNINQTAASAGAFISSAGLVAPIPALAMLTGQTLSWPALSAWLFSVSALGVIVALGLRRHMILDEDLPFATGVATAETLREMYDQGQEAMARVRALLLAGLCAAWLAVIDFLFTLPKLHLPGNLSARSGGALERAGHPTVSPYNLTAALDPSLLLVGIGALIGLRPALSMLVGSVIAWGLLAPMALDAGWVAPRAPDAMWYGGLIKWLVWPGVALMVSGSLTGFAFSYRSVARALRRTRWGESSRYFVAVAAAALVVCVILQVVLFGIAVWLAVLAVVLTVLLAVVAARASGETSVTPVGPLGKVTQMMYGVLAPAQSATNLMAANVTAGAATQCGDLMHDLKSGHILGAHPLRQAIAQLLGALAGALVGSAAYLVLLPNPQEQLGTDQWPAPAAASWKAVAEVFDLGISGLPAGVIEAMVIAGSAGVLLAVLARTLPQRVRPWLPAPVSMGMAFVLPAFQVISIVLGAAAATAGRRLFATWTARFLIVAATGLIAGESVTGVGIALARLLVGD